MAASSGIKAYHQKVCPRSAAHPSVQVTAYIILFLYLSSSSALSFFLFFLPFSLHRDVCRTSCVNRRGRGCTKQEELTTRLRNILEEYPVGAGPFKGS